MLFCVSFEQDPANYGNDQKVYGRASTRENAEIEQVKSIQKHALPRLSASVVDSLRSLRFWTRASQGIQGAVKLVMELFLARLVKVRSTIAQRRNGLTG